MHVLFCSLDSPKLENLIDSFPKLCGGIFGSKMFLHLGFNTTAITDHEMHL